METLKPNSDFGVSYLGPEGTYTHLAATEFFGSKAGLLPCTSIKEVFNNVFQGDVRYGVVGFISIKGIVVCGLNGFG